NIGLIKVKHKPYAEAQRIFEESLVIWREIYPNQQHPSEAYVTNNLGQIFLAQGDYQKADTYFKDALAMYKANYGAIHPEIAATYNLIAQNKLNKGDFKEALESVQEALKANSEHFQSNEIDKNPASNDVFSPSIFFSSLMLKANILRQQYLLKTLRLSDIENALSCLKNADEVLDIQRQQSNSNKDKLLLSASSAMLYERAVSLCNLLAVETQKRSEYYEKAFYFSEKAKATILLEAINETKAKKFGNIPASLLEEEKNLKIDINFVEQQIALKPDEKSLEDYKYKLFTLKRDYEKLQETFETDYPKYFKLKYDVEPVKLATLQAQLDEETLLLDYMLGTDQVFVFMIDSKKIDLVSLERDAEFDENITYLLNAIRFKLLPRDYTEVAYNLYKKLFPKRIKKNIKQIVVIQDGRLATLPMETLIGERVRNAEDLEYAKLPFLLKDWTFSYAYSATLWHQSTQTSASQEVKIALFAPVEFEKGVDLYATEKEVTSIARTCESKKVTSQIFLRQDAKEEVVKRNSTDKYSILHFATHGLVDEENPELSQILLTKSEKEDGNLFAGEVYNLQLNADLVTLSACEVGLGKLSKGEGVIGLGRAFLYAGANNLVLSLWEVSDESTAELMIDFYETKLNNSDNGYARALQKAKLDLLQDETFSAPYYWAAFLVLGR
ncbi:MAG: CHAT domain-containing tetratricopeptide repeat protein, partial [Bacteroidota bacterium]